MPQGMEAERVRYECMDHRITVDVTLNGQAAKGLYRVLFASCYPMSPICLGAGEQEEKVWEVAEQLGCTKQLTKDAGVDADSTEILWDDEKGLDELMEEDKVKEGEPAAQAATQES